MSQEWSKSFAQGAGFSNPEAKADPNKRKGDEQKKMENQQNQSPGAAPAGVAGTLESLMTQAGNSMSGVYDSIFGDGTPAKKKPLPNPDGQ